MDGLIFASVSCKCVHYGVELFIVHTNWIPKLKIEWIKLAFFIAFRIEMFLLETQWTVTVHVNIYSCFQSSFTHATSPSKHDSVHLILFNVASTNLLCCYYCLFYSSNHNFVHFTITIQLGNIIIITIL